MWGLKHVEQLIEVGGINTVNTEIEELRDRLDSFMLAMQNIIKNSPHQNIKEEAYISICDLLVVFSDQLTSSNTTILNDLVFEPDKQMQLMLNDFIQTYVFIPEQDGNF